MLLLAFSHSHYSYWPKWTSSQLHKRSHWNPIVTELQRGWVFGWTSVTWCATETAAATCNQHQGLGVLSLMTKHKHTISSFNLFTPKIKITFFWSYLCLNKCSFSIFQLISVADRMCWHTVACPSWSRSFSPITLQQTFWKLFSPLCWLLTSQYHTNATLFKGPFKHFSPTSNYTCF